MKYIRYIKDEEEYVGIKEGNSIYRLDYTSLLDAVDDEDRIKETYKNSTVDCYDDVEVLTPTIPSKIVCIGLNYKDHAEELHMDLPEEPLLFMKSSSSIIGDGDSIIYPNSSNKMDYEAELGIVIIDKINYESYDKNLRIAYTIINDVTARDLQEKDGQWTRAKNFDTFCPYGPVIVTGINPNNLNINLRVNGNLKQNSNTSNMIFSPAQLVEYISNIMTLNPGDVIATGTPPGVGQLEIDDEICISIEEIGHLKNTVK